MIEPFNSDMTKNNMSIVKQEEEFVPEHIMKQKELLMSSVLVYIFKLGKSLMIIENYSGALMCFQQIKLNVCQNNIDILLDKGECLKIVENYNEALKVYDQIWAVHPWNEIALRGKGEVLSFGPTVLIA